jgi:hypothetical protein
MLTPLCRGIAPLPANSQYSVTAGEIVLVAKCRIFDLLTNFCRAGLKSRCTHDQPTHKFLSLTIVAAYKLPRPPFVFRKVFADFQKTIHAPIWRSILEGILGPVRLLAGLTLSD